jgi:predicted NodU family carbamoyl transferase
MVVLGIHDAHDAGAAAVDKGKMLGAVNEERFTNLKMMSAFR